MISKLHEKSLTKLINFLFYSIALQETKDDTFCATHDMVSSLYQFISNSRYTIQNPFFVCFIFVENIKKKKWYTPLASDCRAHKTVLKKYTVYLQQKRKKKFSSLYLHYTNASVRSRGI